MKKWLTALLCVLLTLAMVFSLAACGEDTKKKRKSSDDDDEDDEKTSENGDVDEDEDEDENEDEDDYDYEDGQIGNTDEPFNTQNKQTRPYPGGATDERVEYEDYDTPSYELDYDDGYYY